MSDIETAESMASWCKVIAAKCGRDEMVDALKQWQAAIRRQVVEEVLGKAEIEMPTEAGWIRSSVTKAHFARLRSEYASQDKSMNTNQTETETSSAHDEEVARRAMVEVLKVVRGIVNMEEREMRIAAISGYAEHHGITPAEIEPQKVYTVDDIVVVGDESECSVQCGKMGWAGTCWVDAEDGHCNTKHDAEAIAAHLRATGNVPGGGA